MLGQLALSHELGQGAWSEPGILSLFGGSSRRIDGPDPAIGNRGAGNGPFGRVSLAGFSSCLGQDFASCIRRHRLRASSRSADRTISSTDPTSSTVSSTPRISSGP
jgi:hypothetical protein